MSKSHSFRFLFAAFIVLFSLAACDSPEEKEAKYIHRGNALYEQGEYEKARLEYKNASRINPTSAEVRYRLGLVSEALNDLRGAFLSFLSAEEQNPRSIPALLKIAHYYLAAQQDDQAMKRIKTVLEMEPDNAQAHALQASFYLQHGSYADSEKEALFALQKDPKNVVAFIVLIRAYQSLNEPAKAAETIEKAIKENPKELSLYLMKAMFYAASSDLGKVTDAYQGIFVLKPEVPRFRLDLADLYVKAGEKEAALKILREGVEAQPDNEAMYRAFVDFLDKTEGLSAAEEEIRKTLETKPSHSLYKLWLADLYMKHKDSDRAIALLQEMVGADGIGNPDTLETARTSLARLQLARGERELAKKLVDAVLEERPNNAEALFLRARFAFERGDYLNAVNHLRTIVRDDPRSRQALQLLAETLLIQGRLDLAIDTLSQLVSVDPTYMEAQIRLAQFYNLNGETKRALDLLNIVKGSRPDMPVAFESDARIAIGAKEWKRAEESIAKLASFPGQESTATFIEGELSSAKGNLQEAARFYKKAVTAAPRSALAEYGLSALFRSARSPEEVKELVSFIKTLPDETPSSLSVLGECYLRLHNPDEAAAQFDKAIAMSPVDQKPYLHRAQLWARKGKADEALAVLDQAMRVAPGDARAPMLQADILSRIGRYEEAIKTYEAILVQSPKADIAANNMAQLIADSQSEDKEALEKARIAAERFISSDNPLFLDTLAWVYYRLGNVAQAQTIMDRVMTFADKLPAQVFFHRGAILYKNGRLDEAKAALQKALEGNQAYSGRAEAEKLFKSL